MERVPWRGTMESFENLEPIKRPGSPDKQEQRELALQELTRDLLKEARECHPESASFVISNIIRRYGFKLEIPNLMDEFIGDLSRLLASPEVSILPNSKKITKALNLLKKYLDSSEYIAAPEKILGIRGSQFSNWSDEKKASFRTLFQLALKQLSSKNFQVFELKKLKGYSYREVAMILGLSLSVVKVRTHRSMNMMKDHLSCNEEIFQ